MDIATLETWTEDALRSELEIQEDAKSKKKQAIIDDDLLLLKLNNRVRSSGRRLPQPEYQNICNKQIAVKSRLMGSRIDLGKISDSITRIKRELSRRNNLQFKDTGAHQGTVEKLDALQKKYSEFSGDTSRIGSMRAMAAVFAQEIRDIIRSPA